MTVIKTCDFEAGATTGAGAFTSVTGVPTIDSTSLIKGVDCVDCTWVNATVFGTNSGLSITDLYISFYFRITALPASSVRILNTSNGASQGNIVINSSGTLNIRNAGTVIGSASSALSINTTYRIGFRDKCSTAIGNADEIIEGYLALGDATFGAAFASSSAQLMVTSNANFTSMTAGNTNSSTTSSTIKMDDIIIDDAVMPGPSGVAAPEIYHVDYR